MNETETLDNQEDQAGPATKLRSQIESINIAADLDDVELEKISHQCKEGFDYDLQSRSTWEDNLDEWTKLALQVKEEKTFPWVNASNVKYPLLSTAAMQFNARAYPSLVPANGNIVNVEVIGKDPQGLRSAKAERIATYMSYQLLNGMECWEDDMDKLLVMLPIVGTVFKKTYYSGLKKSIISELILPKNVVVNYWAKSLDTAERISEIIPMSKRRLIERQRAEEYLDIDLGEPQQREGKQDETTPYDIIEQHTFYDLDGDGYSEPYVITFERHTGKVLRMVARYDDRGIQVNDKGKLQKIEPIQYYTKFSFIPNPDGGFYDMGFGLLLAPINESVNTIINQLIDAGTISNLQGGFLGKGLKLKMGESRWTPGEWKTVNTTSDDLRKQILPLPVKEPSNVLFELMGQLVTSGKELASVAEIFVGKMPGQNTPATTTMATIEQGMKVFTAVYKRVYRSLKCEFKKIFELNNLYLDMQEYQMVDNEPVMQDDFDPDQYDVCPSADPSIATQTEKLMKAQGLMELLPVGTLDPVEVTRRILEAQDQPNADKLLHPQIQQTGQMPQQPDPKVQELQMKAQMDQQKFQLQAQHENFKSDLAQRDQIFQHQMEAMKLAMEQRHEQVMTAVKASAQYHSDQAKIQGEMMRHQQQMVQSDQQHQQSMRHQEEAAKLKNQQLKSGSATGKTTKSPKR
jgi:chaperonin GroES